MDYTARLTRFQQTLAAQADLAFFPRSADLQYLTGVGREMPTFGRTRYPGQWIEGAWIRPEGEPVFLLTRMTATFHGLDQMPGDLTILADDADPVERLREVARGLPDQPRIAVGETAHAATLTGLQALLPGAHFLSASALLDRRRKDPDELDILRRAGAITEAAFSAVVPHLRHGMTELDIISEVDYQLKRHGAAAPSFTTAMYNAGPGHPLSFGHQEARWDRPLLPPVALLFDFGAVVEGYCYDFGRTVAFGEPEGDLPTIHALVMAAQQAGIAALKSGSTGHAADAAARAVIEAGGYGAAFRHRLGHGIGLDVHEPPYLTAGDHTPLAAGMTFTVEPSIMQMAGFSARVEDVVVVGEAGGIPLTTGYADLIVVA